MSNGCTKWWERKGDRGGAGEKGRKKGEMMGGGNKGVMGKKKIRGPVGEKGSHRYDYLNTWA